MRARARIPWDGGRGQQERKTRKSAKGCTKQCISSGHKDNSGSKQRLMLMIRDWEDGSTAIVTAIPSGAARRGGGRGRSRKDNIEGDQGYFSVAAGRSRACRVARADTPKGRLSCSDWDRQRQRPLVRPSVLLLHCVRPVAAARAISINPLPSSPFHSPHHRPRSAFPLFLLATSFSCSLLIAFACLVDLPLALLLSNLACFALSFQPLGQFNETSSATSPPRSPTTFTFVVD